MEATAFYPVQTKREKELPFYITSIGTTPKEERIYRPMGSDSYQILYTKKGSGIAKLYNEYVTLPEKSLLILPPNIQHFYEINGNEWETCWITFNGWGVERFFCVDASVVLVPDEVAFLDKFNSLISLRMNPQWEYRSSVELYSLLLACKELFPEESGSDYKKRKQLKESFIYIQNRYMDVIELECLAKISGMTREHLCRVFKQYTGMRPFEYIAKIRIQKAKELLVLNREMSVAEIAKKTGFQSNSYFSLVFRKYQGCTAEEYRKRE